MSQSSFSVRPGRPADAELLFEMGHRTFLHTFGPPNDPIDVATYMAATYAREIQAAELADPMVDFLVVMDDELPAGYAKLRRGVAGPGVRGTNPLEVQRFYADVPYIGRGVGAVLMNRIIAHAEDAGHDSLWLAVWEHNPKARRFYERFGFRLVGTQEFHLGRDLQHDQVLERHLGDRTPR